MNLLITNYALDKVAKTLTYNDYVSTGLTLNQIILVFDITTKTSLYNILDPLQPGTIAGNVLTFTGNIDFSTVQNTDSLYVVVADPNANQNVTLGSGIRDDLDSISSNPAATTPHRITNTQNVLGNSGKLASMYVAATTGGTIQFFDSATTTTAIPLTGLITPAVGFHNLGNWQAVNGIYAVIAGAALDVTIATGRNSL